MHQPEDMLMTAATITNAQSAIVLQVEKAKHTVKVNFEEAKETALESGRVAAKETKVKAKEVALQLSMLLPVLLVLFVVMLFCHVNFGIIARMFPMFMFALVGYTALCVLNPGESRTEP
jgi:hypothetical protein